MITKNTIKPLALAVLMAGAAGCEPDIEREFPADASGSADFSTYVALGNSLTAGFSDGFLNRAGQVNSYPAILADKMAAVTPDFSFAQPLMPQGVVNGTLQLQLTNGSIGIAPEQDGISIADAGTPVRGVFQNLGVPSAKVADLTRTEMQSPFAKYFFNRFAQTGKSVVQMATDQNPTFFTLWIGANDVLEWATSGGENDPATPYVESITDQAAYRTSLEAIITELKQANPSIEGAMGNIPSISAIPFFNVVPWDAFVLELQIQVDQLNAGFAAQIDPVIRQKVEFVVLNDNIIPAVAQGVVYQQAYAAAYQQAKDAGATDAEADAIATDAAQNYVASEEGQATINSLISSLRSDQQPAQVYDIVLQQFNSDPVQAQIAAAVDQQIAQLKAANLYPTFQLGRNGFVVASNDSPTGLKQLTAAEKMLLTFQNRTLEEFNPAAGNVIVPDKYALDIFEVQQVSAAIAGYNQHIAEVAAENTFALVDINGYFGEFIAAEGLTIEGIKYNAQYADISDVDPGAQTGDGVTIFSLDGVHPNQRGYGIIARRFAEEINQFYNAKLPLPQPSNYPLIPLPAN